MVSENTETIFVYIRVNLLINEWITINLINNEM